MRLPFSFLSCLFFLFIPTMYCPPRSDRSFGPRVDINCRSFDFTLQFEDIFFSCLPAALFLILSPSRIVLLLRRYKPVAFSLHSKLLASKLIALASLLVSQLIILVLRARQQMFQTNASIAADVLSIIATSVALLLSYLDHRRSPRPSTLLSLYLSVLVVLGIARTRTTWLLLSGGPIPVTMTVIFTLTVTTLLLESIEKKTSLITIEKYPAPEMTSGFWTRTCFTWLAATFWTGYSKIISVDDLPSLDTKLESHVLHESLESTWTKYNHRERHSLLQACLRGYIFSFLSPIIPRLCITAFTFSQPFLINTIIHFVGQQNPDRSYGKGLIGACALVYLGIALSTSIYQYQNFRFTTRLRGGLVALVYERALQTRVVDMGDITAVALMGTDVERIVQGMQFFHEVWGSLLDIAIASWLLGRQLSLACLAPIILIAVFVAATTKISLFMMTAQRRWIEKVQGRLQVTETLLGNIKAVKMLGLTEVMSKVIQGLRVNEIDTSRAFRKLHVATLLLSLTPINLAPVVTFAVYSIISVFWKNETLLTAQAFTSVTLIALLTTPVLIFIQVLPMVIQTIASFDRIQKYSNYSSGSESNDDNHTSNENKPKLDLELTAMAKSKDIESIPLQSHSTISFSGESFAWNQSKHPILTNIKCGIPCGAITAIIGPVGSGKSSFLNSLLGEMISLTPQNFSKRAHIKSVAYCSQESWLENGTIRQNIIGVLPFEPKWYNTVKFVCGLDADFKQIQIRDSTRIGSKGLNLSGGQKQRIALARAVYARRSVIILDDAFSGMDAHTAAQVSSRLLGREGLLQKHNTTVVLATHSHKIMSLADNIISLHEGKIVENGSPSALLRENGYFSKLSVSSSTTQDNVDEILEIQDAELNRKSSQEPEDVVEKSNPLLDVRRKNGEMSVYRYYLANAGYTSIGFYTVAIITVIFCSEFPTIWLKWWSEANTTHPNEKIGMYMGIYAMFGVIAALGIFMAAWFAFISIISNTATNMHSDLLKASVKAPFQFFTSVDSGELLNRFSQDMELIDMDLPSTMVNYTSTAVSVIAKIIILVVFSQYLGATLPILGTVLYFLQRFYLQTSRQVRLLGIEARAPLYTHFTESVAGAATIRAFGWKLAYQERNYQRIDTSQRPIYLQQCIQAWLAFVLNVVAAAIAVILVGTVVTWHDKFNPGSVGVSLVMIVGFSETLSRLIQTWTKMESSVGAVARVKRFIDDTESEEKVGGANVPFDWPQTGALDFMDVVAAHGSNSASVLDKVTLHLPANHHTAIIGRSGSGKTSLLLSLLGMLPLTSGRIVLDNIDISTLSPALLRSRINVISQDPFLLPGSVRFNIDPFASISDDDIVRALKRVGLFDVVENQGGLDSTLDTNAWSTGQKQLICLARAMVRKGRVLVVDEGMSSVDAETESLMQQIIDEEFKDYTVLAVMHRLEHIERYDTVVLIDEGRVVEVGEPRALKREAGSKFARLQRLGGSERRPIDSVN